SAVVIYWNERLLQPHESRTVGFTYGLGSVAGSEGGGKLAGTVGGAFVPGGEFSVTAYVAKPLPGQTGTLTLPEGMALIEGVPTQAVPELPAGATTRNSPVTWKVRAPGREGNYSLRVQSSTGAAQTQAVRVQARGIFGN